MGLPSVGRLDEVFSTNPWSSSKKYWLDSVIWSNLGGPKSLCPGTAWQAAEVGLLRCRDGTRRAGPYQSEGIINGFSSCLPWQSFGWIHSACCMMLLLPCCSAAPSSGEAVMASVQPTHVFTRLGAEGPTSSAVCTQEISDLGLPLTRHLDG